MRLYSPTRCITCIELYGTQAKTSADAKHGTTDREDVDDVAHPSVDLVSNKWVKAGADGHGKALPVAHESQEETDHYVHNPSMNTPMEESQIHRVLGQLVISVPK